MAHEAQKGTNTRGIFEQPGLSIAGGTVGLIGKQQTAEVAFGTLLAGGVAAESSAITSNFMGSTNVGNGLALGQQLLSGFELADDLLGCVASSSHCGVPGSVWPDEDSHSPWNDSQGPRQGFRDPRTDQPLHLDGTFLRCYVFKA